jgi:hypothetical protein
MQFGPNKWKLVTTVLPARSPRQCRERWLKYLCPANSFKPFTPEEDILLTKLYAQYGSKWMKISRSFQNRTDITLKNRWLVLKRQEHKLHENGREVDSVEPQVLNEPEQHDPLPNLCPDQWRTGDSGDDDWQMPSGEIESIED